MMKKTSGQNKNKGFTIIELIISLAIFSFMTALLVAKYGTFNQGILLTNLAYEVALTIRNAQSYGLNVKSAPQSGTNFSGEFTYPYGVHLNVSNGADSTNNNNPFNKEVIFFSDSSSAPSDKYIYDDILEKISFNNIKRGSYIKDIRVGNNSCNNIVSTVDITFTRPDPNARIYADGDNSAKYNCTEITLQSSDGGTKKVIVRSTGEIEITN